MVIDERRRQKFDGMSHFFKEFDSIAIEKPVKPL
jgi:hypothetical protein